MKWQPPLKLLSSLLLASFNDLCIRDQPHKKIHKIIKSIVMGRSISLLSLKGKFGWQPFPQLYCVDTVWMKSNRKHEQVSWTLIFIKLLLLIHVKKNHKFWWLILMGQRDSTQYCFWFERTLWTPSHVLCNGQREESGGFLCPSWTSEDSYKVLKWENHSNHDSSSQHYCALGTVHVSVHSSYHPQRTLREMLFLLYRWGDKAQRGCFICLPLHRGQVGEPGSELKHSASRVSSGSPITLPLLLLILIAARPYWALTSQNRAGKEVPCHLHCRDGGEGRPEFHDWASSEFMARRISELLSSVPRPRLGSAPQRRLVRAVPSPCGNSRKQPFMVF